MSSSGSSEPPVAWADEGTTFLVLMRHPPANQLGTDLVSGLSAAVAAFERSAARTLLITSQLPGFFGAGGDIKLMASADASTFAGYLASVRAVLDRIAALDRPSVAVIEGRALGGGLELALACTMRVGSSAARLGLPEPTLGLIPGGGGTQRLPRLIGRAHALDLLLTAREVSGPEAGTIGLLDRVTEPGGAITVARDLAGRFAALSGPALTAILRCADDAADLSLADGLAREAARVNELFAGDDGREGLAAFVARRAPRFAR